MVTGDRARMALVLVLAFVALGPIYVMVSNSLATQNDIFSDEVAFFFAPTFQNYEEVLGERQLRRYLVNSLIVGTVSTVLTLLIGALAAYALQRFRFPGRNAINTGTLLTRLVPPAVLAVPVFLIWNYGFEIAGTRYGLILIYVAINLPFVVWILQSFIEQLPSGLEEAARMDGAGTAPDLLPRRAAAHPAGAGGGGDLHVPHRVERVHPRLRADGPFDAHPARPRLDVPDELQLGVGADHGHRHVDRAAAADLHAHGQPPDHHRPDGGSREGMRSPPFRPHWCAGAERRKCLT